MILVVVLFVLSATEVAVTVTVQAGVPVAGALYVAANVGKVGIVSEPQPVAGLKLHATPLFAGSPATAAPSACVVPSATVVGFVAGVVMVTVSGVTVIVVDALFVLSTAEEAVIVATQFAVPAIEAAGVKLSVEVLPLTTAVPHVPHVPVWLTPQVIPPPVS